MRIVNLVLHARSISINLLRLTSLSGSSTEISVPDGIILVYIIILCSIEWLNLFCRL